MARLVGETDAAYKARRQAEYQAWKAKHNTQEQRDKDAKRGREWREKNRTRHREYIKVRYHSDLRHRDYSRSTARRRRQGFTKEGIEYADTVLTGDPCCYCGASVDWMVVDHIVPHRHGGLGDSTNLTMACNTCNLRKSTRPLLHFLLLLQATKG